MIWLFLILVALTAVLFLFGKDRAEAGFDPLDHYRAQLDEIAEDEARGVVDVDEAKAARLEVERRLLKAAKRQSEAKLDRGDKRIPAVLAVLAVIAGVALYAVFGRPGLPEKPGAVISSRHEAIQEGGPTYDEAIKAVRKHLRDEPEDAKGWEVLAKSSRAVRDFSAAANAFAELARLQPENHGWRVQQFEAMMAMASGQITPAARLVLGALIEDAPDHPAGQYYLGLLRRQSGDNEGAKAVWQALADRSDPNAPWMPTLNDQLRKLGVAPPRLSGDQMAAVANMSDEDRKAFIESMMERLKARLDSDPDDPDGWLMLARSYLSMGDKPAAIAALEQGLAKVSAEKQASLQALLDNLKTNPDL